VIDTKTRKTVSELRDPPPGGPDEGSTPNALALSADESKLYVAEADANAVAVFDLSPTAAKQLVGRVPTAWYPAALAVSGSSLLGAKGRAAAPPANREGPGRRMSREPQGSGRNGTLGQPPGSLSVIAASRLDAPTLDQLPMRGARANGWSDSMRAPRFPP